MSSASKAYQFTLSGTTVTAVYEIENGRLESERMKSHETWAFDGRTVTKTEYENGRLKTTSYSDANGDGLFSKVGTSTGLLNISTGTAPTEKGHRFDLTSDGAVTAVYEVKNGRVKKERIDWNESWFSTGSEVTQVETSFGKVETSVYTDANQNGIYQKAFEIEVITGQHPKSMETFKFVVAGGVNAKGDSVLETDSITGMLELGRRGWKNDAIAWNETLDIVEVDTDHWIVQTQGDRNGKTDFHLYRDDDHDGLWTQVAEGETTDLYLTADGQVDLVGLVNAGLLDAAALLMA